MRLQVEHFLQPIEARRAPDHPARRPDRAFGIDCAGRRAVHDLQALAGAGKDDVMIAGRVADAHRIKADVAGAPRAGDAVAGPLLDLFKFHAPPRRRGAAERERGARWSVDLAAMMHLDDLDIKIGAEALGDVLDDAQHYVDAEAHIRRPDDRDLARGLTHPVA